MANIVIYDIGTSRVLQYRKFVNTPDYDGRADVIVNPDLSALREVPLKYWKVEGGLVVEMNTGEKNAVDQEEAESIVNLTRATAKEKLNGFIPDALFLRAFVTILIDEINILRGAHSLPDRSLSQLKTVILAKIDSGDVD